MTTTRLLTAAHESAPCDALIDHQRRVTLQVYELLAAWRPKVLNGDVRQQLDRLEALMLAGPQVSFVRPMGVQP